MTDDVCSLPSPLKPMDLLVLLECFLRRRSFDPENPPRSYSREIQMLQNSDMIVVDGRYIITTEKGDAFVKALLATNEPHEEWVVG